MQHARGLRYSNTELVANPGEKGPLGHRDVGGRIILKESRREGMFWIHVARFKERLAVLVAYSVECSPPSLRTYLGGVLCPIASELDGRRRALCSGPTSDHRAELYVRSVMSLASPVCAFM